MQVSDWWMLLSFYQNVLAVPLGIVVLVLLLRAKATRRILYGALLVLVFLPHIQLYAGNYYFDYLCRTQAGEFIYRTVDNVEGILQMRPRDGSKDYFDRMRAGDVPEDPWGHTNREAQYPWHMINGYRFIEVPIEGVVSPPRALQRTYDVSMFESVPEGARIARFLGYDGKSLATFRKEFDSSYRSKYGFTWEEVSDPVGRLLGIRQGQIKVVELKSGDVLGRKVGFYRLRPIEICPTGKSDSLAEDFVAKVARPSLPRDRAQ